MEYMYIIFSSFNKIENIWSYFQIKYQKIIWALLILSQWPLSNEKDL